MPALVVESASENVDTVFKPLRHSGLVIGFERKVGLDYGHLGRIDFARGDVVEVRPGVVAQRIEPRDAFRGVNLLESLK